MIKSHNSRQRRAEGVAIAVFVATMATGAAFAAAPPAMPPGHVTVSEPLERRIAERSGFLGQFSAVDRVELRAQVGGTLTEIHFQDGQIVHKGDLLFVIDPRPYQIKFAQAQAQVQSAQARLALTGSELWRAQQLKQTSFGTAETVDQRVSDQRNAQAALDQAQAAVRDAALDLEFSHVVAPFTGRIGAHQVSIGNLVSGSRAGTTATTLLATLVSLDPIHLDFDMSESDYLAYARARARAGEKLADSVDVSLGDENKYDRHGTLDFIDNSLDRASGTIHARATVPNPDLFLVPGEFARLRLTVAQPAPVLMVPADAVVPDQSQTLVMTVAPDNSVVPKIVTLGGTRGGLRVVTAGLQPTDKVIVDGLMHAMPGAKVVPEAGTIRFDADADAQD
jgi:RND family efflux transporter MFP subunit